MSILISAIGSADSNISNQLKPALVDSKAPLVLICGSNIKTGTEVEFNVETKKIYLKISKNEVDSINIESCYVAPNYIDKGGIH